MEEHRPGLRLDSLLESEGEVPSVSQVHSLLANLNLRVGIRVWKGKSRVIQAISSVDHPGLSKRVTFPIRNFMGRMTYFLSRVLLADIYVPMAICLFKMDFFEWMPGNQNLNVSHLDFLSLVKCFLENILWHVPLTSQPHLSIQPTALFLLLHAAGARVPSRPVCSHDSHCDCSP